MHSKTVERLEIGYVEVNPKHKLGIELSCINYCVTTKSAFYRLFQTKTHVLWIFCSQVKDTAYLWNQFVYRFDTGIIIVRMRQNAIRGKEKFLELYQLHESDQLSAVLKDAYDDTDFPEAYRSVPSRGKSAMYISNNIVDLVPQQLRIAFVDCYTYCINIHGKQGETVLTLSKVLEKDRENSPNSELIVSEGKFKGYKVDPRVD